MNLVPLIALAASLAAAPPSDATQVESPPPTTAVQPAPAAPYVAPWTLRGASPTSTVRLDDTLALAKTTTTEVLFLSASYALRPDFGVVARLGGVGNWPEAGSTGYAFVNPAVGAVYGLKLGDVRLAAYLNLVLPLGMGGGDTPDKSIVATVKSGALARSAMDNAIFASNFATAVPGVDVAYLRGGATLQLEATLLQLERVRGSAVEKDAARTNFTAGALAGYQFIPALSGSLELRYQRWLSTPAAVAADSSLRDNFAGAVGLRTKIPLSDRVTLRPGLSYTRGLEGALSKNAYNTVQLDLPVAF